MSESTVVAIGTLIPFLGTFCGAGLVFFVRDEIPEKLNKLLLGFASGVMLAACVWSLLLPSLNMAREQGLIEWLPAASGFLLGIGFLLLLDCVIPHLHTTASGPEGVKSNFARSTMLVLAVTLHNIPEGMAVGVVLAGVISNGVGISVAGAFTLALGIALQNFPEGAVVTLPLAANGVGKRKAFAMGALSGIVEPISALITIALTELIVPAMPYVLAFAAGAMVYVVVEELIPDAQAGSHSNIGTIGTALGFVLMLVLEVALS